MTQTLDRELLGKVSLTRFDIQTIGGLVKRGGETNWYPSGKPEWLLRAVESMIERKLVQIIERIPHGLYMRLTDKGRAVATQLEAMNAAPKVEVVQA